MKPIDMAPMQDNQVHEENAASSPTNALTSMPESQPDKMLIVGEEPEIEADEKQAAMPPALPPSTRERRKLQVSDEHKRLASKPESFSKLDEQTTTALRDRCRQLCVALFFREQAPVHSLGFTSAVSGEGKTFLARLTAAVAAHDNDGPTTLLECAWDHPSLHDQFGISPTPGLAEWLRGECSEEDIRYQVGENLFVIPAGNAKEDAIKLLRQLHRGGLSHLRTTEDELLIVDLPPILTTGYGALAASLVEALMVVVRAGMTPNQLIKDTCEHLKDLPVEGLILNQTSSRIPHWIRELL
jgi:Mrp family chromosome partitioning ATPase